MSFVAPPFLQPVLDLVGGVAAQFGIVDPGCRAVLFTEVLP